MLARITDASWFPWLLAALAVLLWATYPTWFYVGFGAAAAPGYSLPWASAYVSVKMALFGGRWLVGSQRYRPLWAHVRSPLFRGGDFLFMTNAGLFNLTLSALGGVGTVLLLESWAVTAAALLALAAGQARRLCSPRSLLPYGVLPAGLALGAFSVGVGFPAGFDLLVAALGYICAAAAVWGSVWAVRVCARTPERTYSATMFRMAISRVSSLIAMAVMVRLSGASVVPGAGFLLDAWLTAASAGLATGMGDGVSLHGLFLLLPVVSVGGLAVAGGAGVGRWELFLPGLALSLPGNLL